jgi:GGDEF domain-containing protein
MAGTLHDGLGARELNVGAKSFDRREIRTADQQESELRFAQFLVEFGVAASHDIDLEGVLRLLDHAVIERVLAREGRERRCHDLPEIGLLLRTPELLAIAAIDLAEHLSNQAVGALLAQFNLQRLHEGNEHLGLDFRLLDDGNTHIGPPDFSKVITKKKAPRKRRRPGELGRLLRIQTITSAQFWPRSLSGAMVEAKFPSEERELQNDNHSSPRSARVRTPDISSEHYTEGERRQVAVLFADLVGFTAFSERAGEEASFRLMQRISAILADIVHGQGGTVGSFTGDGIMALFGVPVALEDASLRACRAALLIQQHLGSNYPDIKDEYGVHPQMRIGIGFVFSGRFREGINLLRHVILASDEDGDGTATLGRIFLAEIYLGILEGRRAPPLKIILRNLDIIIGTKMFGLRRALALLDRAGRNEQLHKDGTIRARINMDIGLLYKVKKRPALARQFLEKARAPAELQGNAFMVNKIDAALASL